MRTGTLNGVEIQQLREYFMFSFECKTVIQQYLWGLRQLIHPAVLLNIQFTMVILSLSTQRV